MRLHKGLHKNRSKRQIFDFFRTSKSRWAGLGINVMNPIAALKDSFSTSYGPKHDANHEEREHEVNKLVDAISKQLRDVQLSNEVLDAVREHLESMPLTYVHAGFCVGLLLHHIRLLQQSKDEHKPTILVREHHCKTSDSIDQDDSLSVSSLSSGWVSSDDEQTPRRSFEMHFACPSTVSESAAMEALVEAGITVNRICVFLKGRFAMGVALIQTGKEDIAEEKLRHVLRNASRRSKKARSLLKSSGKERPLVRTDEVRSTTTAKENDLGRLVQAPCAETNSHGSYMEDCSSYGFDMKSIPDSSGVGDDLDSSRGIFKVPSTGTLMRVLVNEGQDMNSAREALSKLFIDGNDLEVGDVIATGSSGSVYEGMYEGHKVAVKRLKRFCNESSTDGEFRREVLGLISCAHKNVLKLYGVCVDSRHGLCIVTKFMEGGSLLQYLQRQRKLNMKQLLKFAKDIAEGMQFLHSQGVIHMDLKAANVLLDEEGNAVIGDLGVARLSNETEGIVHEIGSYRWMAPEVYAAESGKVGITSKSDVYSYGILLWELATCELPYADYGPVQAAAGVVMHGLRPTFPAAIFPPLRCLIEKCWAQEPSDRPHFSQIVKMLKIISK